MYFVDNSSNVCFDIIKRILINHFHINVSDVLNITDVDDKIITTEQEPNPIVSTEAVAAAPPEQELEEQEPSSAEPLTT